MGQQKQSFHGGLCYENTVKRIPMHIWQVSHGHLKLLRKTRFRVVTS